jgi:hypothetical protein
MAMSILKMCGCSGGEFQWNTFTGTAYRTIESMWRERGKRKSEARNDALDCGRV